MNSKQRESNSVIHLFATIIIGIVSNDNRTKSKTQMNCG